MTIPSGGMLQPQKAPITDPEEEHGELLGGTDVPEGSEPLGDAHDAEGIHALIQSLPLPHTPTIEERTDLSPQGGMPDDLDGETQPEPTLGQDVGLGDINDPSVQRALAAMYGQEFPLLDEDPEDHDWADWAISLWSMHESAMRPMLHFAERNRLMARHGIQWLSAQGLGPWKEPPKPRDTVRAVENMIGPALQQRQQILAEQRPGFRTKPENQDPKNLKKAEAQQDALEYQYDQQQMSDIIGEAYYWAATDGVSFPCTYWDPDAGPWDEQLVPQGQDQQGNPQFGMQKGPKGDCQSKVYRIEQVRVSANATATQKPFYWVIRETIPTAEAVRDYGVEVLEGTSSELETDVSINMNLGLRQGTYTVGPEQLFQDQPKIDRLTVYCEKSDVLKQGLTLVVVGRKLVVGPLPLVSGMVPVWRFTDGSEDPSFYPRPIMNGWVDSQMRYNAAYSIAINSARVNAGGRLLMRENAVAQETLIGGMLSAISIKGGGSLTDNIQPLQGFSVGPDVEMIMERSKKAFEDVSGWNDTTRGSFEGDPSGRAILAQRETVERIFAPMVGAACKAMSQGWARISLAWLHYGYDAPRTIAVEGANRTDLARVLNSDDFDGVANVTIDPETLMPMPRALRLFVLDNLLEKGAMTMDDYRRRQPFAFVQNLDSPDTDQSARAKRVCQSIRESGNPQALPLLWQDNEAIHQDCLERELILPDDTDPQVRQAAIQRWQQLAQQASAKQPPPPPNNMDATYQKFVQDTTNKVLQASTAFVAKEVEMAQGIVAPPAPPAPPGQPGQSGPPRQGGGSSQHQGPPPQPPMHHAMGGHTQLPPGLQPILSNNPGLAAGPPGSTNPDQHAMQTADFAGHR